MIFLHIDIDSSDLKDQKYFDIDPSDYICVYRGNVRSKKRNHKIGDLVFYYDYNGRKTMGSESIAS